MKRNHKFLVVGLGNPGNKYDGTRHNIGFELINFFLKKHKVDNFKNQSNALVSKLVLKSRPVLFVKPQKFMNSSGEVVSSLMRYYKISLDDLLVIHDDVDQQFGAIKFQKNRGSGGHNGVRSINEMLRSQDYCRLKIGVSKSDNTHDHVLSKFQDEEFKHMTELLNYCVLALEEFIFGGFESAIQLNRKAFK